MRGVTSARAGAGGEHFERLCRELRPRVYRFALARLGDADLAEDIAQETLLALLHARADGAVLTPLSSWLFGVARNHINGRFRAAGRARAVLLAVAREPRAPAPPTDAVVHARRLLAVCARVLAMELTPRGRRIFELRFAAGCSTRAIAAQLGCSVPAVRASLRRTRRSLARAHPELAERLRAGF